LQLFKNSVFPDLRFRRLVLNRDFELFDKISEPHVSCVMFQPFQVAPKLERFPFRLGKAVRIKVFVKLFAVLFDERNVITSGIDSIDPGSYFRPVFHGTIVSGDKSGDKEIL
jgi:hypothetical protein